MMYVVMMLIVGLAVGAAAKALMPSRGPRRGPGKDTHAIVAAMFLGILGSMLVGLIGRAFGLYRSPGEAPGLIASMLGAVLLLWVYRVIKLWRVST